MIVCKSNKEKSLKVKSHPLAALEKILHLFLYTCKSTSVCSHYLTNSL